MRILLTANASYVPPRGGATRSNLIWLDQMARAGHLCRIVCGPSREGAELGYHPSIAVFAVEDPEHARTIYACVRPRTAACEASGARGAKVHGLACAAPPRGY